MGGYPDPPLKETAMPTLVLGEKEVHELLSMADCIEVMDAALRDLAGGAAVQPLRSVMRLHHAPGLLGVMPGSVGDPEVIGGKVITVFPGNSKTPYDSHQGVVLMFEPEHGRLAAIMDASSITAIRTAAVSGLATRALARPDAGELALLGAGVQAATHLQAMACVRTLRRIRVWGPNPDRCADFAARQSALHGLEVIAVEDPRAAVEGADLVCTVSSAQEPVLMGEWLAAGAHVNAVGACTPKARELDAAAVAGSILFTDRRESLLAEAGDFLLAKEEGAVDDDHLAGELGEVLLGQVQGRREHGDITLFKSLGLAVEDLAAARFLHDRARQRGVGMDVDLGGLRK